MTASVLCSAVRRRFQLTWLVVSRGRSRLAVDERVRGWRAPRSRRNVESRATLTLIEWMKEVLISEDPPGTCVAIRGRAQPARTRTRGCWRMAAAAGVVSGRG